VLLALPCIRATVFQSEIFGNRKIERSRRGRIATSRGPGQKSNLRGWLAQ
jgi:hypothetical protein